MNMEETAVLLSIRPEWCQKIFRGEKTMEIRKSFPKDFQVIAQKGKTLDSG